MEGKLKTLDGDFKMLQRDFNFRGRNVKLRGVPFFRFQNLLEYGTSRYTEMNEQVVYNWYASSVHVEPAYT